MEIRVEIDTRELADDGMFADIVGDIAADVIRDSGEVEHIVTSTIENDIGYHISTYLEDNPMVDPEDDAFINAVAKAMLNMARSYVGE
ncbi:MAG: hypothetical protein CMB22_02495 [Euryarchaeota archaeon]|nr:hypothetical protein [Euryarchaeota archaeon]|tara:strand:+ start:5476 stop:5739 length:264 start_codon:yes stop_codon:yes gene_type:complete